MVHKSADFFKVEAEPDQNSDQGRVHNGAEVADVMLGSDLQHAAN